MATVPLMRHVVTYWFWVGFLRRRPQEPYFSRRQRRSPRLTVQEPGFDLPFSFNLDDGGRSLSSPAVANGVVYVGGGFNVYALNASTERETAKYLQIHGRRSNHGLGSWAERELLKIFFCLLAVVFSRDTRLR
jgi:PQQ-like domain